MQYNISATEKFLFFSDYYDTPGIVCMNEGEKKDAYY